MPLTVTTITSGQPAANVPSHQLTIPSGQSVPVGQDVLLSVGWRGGSAATAGTVTDSVGNVWSLVRRKGTAVGPTWTDVYKCRPTTAIPVGGWVRWTSTAGDRHPLMALVRLSGARVSPDPLQTVVDADAVSATPSVPSMTAPRSDDNPHMILFATAQDPPPTYSEGASGLTIANLTNGDRRHVVERHSVAPGSLTQTIGGVWSASVSWSAVGILVMPQSPVRNPTALAPSGVTTKPGAVQLLDGRRSTDHPDHAYVGPVPVLSYAWTQLTGPAVALSGANTALASYTVPAGDAPGVVRTFRLTVSNDRGGSNSVTVSHSTGPILPRVLIRLGDIVELIEIDPNAGTADPLADRLVLDGLQIEWAYASPDEQVRQLEPMQATVQLSTLDVTHLAGLAPAQLACVLVFDEYDDHVASVYGRTGEAKARQDVVRVAGNLEVRTTVTVDIVDHTATAGSVIENTTRPRESVDSRIDALRDADGTGLAVRLPPGDVAGQARLVCRTYARAAEYKGAQLVEQLRAILYELPLCQTPGDLYVGEFLLVPIVDESTLELSYLSLHVIPGDGVFDRGLSYFGPLAFAMPDPSHPHSVPADQVEIGGDYTLRANDRPNAVVVTTRNNADTADVTESWYSGRPYDVTVTKTVQHQHLTQTISNGNPRATVEMHFPAAPREFEGDTGWDRDGFTWHPAAFEDITGGWFPDWRAYAGGWRTTSVEDPRPYEVASDCFVAPVAINGIAPAGSLARADQRYTGYLLGAQLTIERGRPVVEFELERCFPMTSDLSGYPNADPNETF